MLEKIKKNKTILILITIMFLSSIWLITRGMPYTHDIEFHYGRIVGLSNTIKDGDFLALIHNSFYGYGYATGLFYSNFFFYIPALFSILGLSYMLSFKLMCVLINILTTLSIYYCLKSITKDNKVSIIGTILYMFSNYRIIDIYVRGAMGEVLAFMIIPIVILGLYEIVYRNYHRWYLFTIGFVLLLLSHLITTFLVALATVIFLICSYKKFIEDKNRIKYLLISGIVGFLLGAFFLFPILEQKLYGNINIFEGGSFFLTQNNAVSIKDFLLPSGFFNKYLGISLVLLLPIRYYIKKEEINSKDLLKCADIFFIIAILAWISTTKIFPWSIFGRSLDFIQFPWRLLIIATSFLTIAYSIYFKLLNKEKVLKYSYIIVILFSILEVSLYSVQYGIRKIQYNKFPINEIGTGEYLIYETDVDRLNKANPKIKTNNSNLDIKYTKKGTNVKITYKNNDLDNTYIEIPLFNYLGYSANGAKITSGDNNVIRLLIDNKEGNIEVKYSGTIVQKVSYIVSTITLVGLIVYLIKERMDNNGFSKDVR